MLDEAQSKYRDINWVCSDATGDLTQLGKFDVVFSNAAIQWMPEQELIVTKLFNMLNDEGVLAVQVPNTHYLPIQTELIRLISSERWKIHYSSFVESYSKL